MTRRLRCICCFLLCTAAFTPFPTATALAQVVPDTTTSQRPEVHAESLPSPRGALFRSLAVPGWGQVYVGQPVKTPFVLGALGGLVGLTIYFNGQYTDYRNAYLYVVNEEAPDPSMPNPDNPYADFFEDWIATGAQAATTTRTIRNNNRRNRDLTILGTGLVYALQALDAYVTAELADFDVSEDLSIQAIPASNGPHLYIVWRF